MTIEEIKELIKVVNESGVAELEVQRGNDRVRIRRNLTAQEMVAPVLTAQPLLAGPIITPPAAAKPASGEIAPAPQENAPEPSKPQPIEETHELVKSPIVGTYYDAASPGAPPFVKVGDRVEPGQVLCIIESMKLMNEIESEIAGTVAAKLVENGRPVEYGEALFAIRPR